MQISIYQKEISTWMKQCFSSKIIGNQKERAMRFLEEALELSQAMGIDKEQALKLVDYTFSRPVGEVFNEVGGVMVTLSALCNSVEMSIEDAAMCEMDRINQPEIMKKIQDKQVTKQVMGITPDDL